MGVPDLTPLETPVSRDEVRDWKAAALQRAEPWARVPLLPLIGLAALVAFYGLFLVATTVGTFRSPPRADEIPVLIFIFLLPLTLIAIVGYLLIRVAVRPWKRWMRLQRFAVANGMSFDPEANAPFLPGALFNAGDQRRVTERLRRARRPHLQFGNYKARFGSGKGRHTRTWGYLAMQLERPLPHMLLDAKANNILATTGLPLSLRTNQVLSLEGDFDKYFTLYCPKEYERDALQVFQPDLMALLIDEAATFDVEIVDDWFFAYSRRPLRLDEPPTMQRMFRIVDTVAERTRKRSTTYRDTRAEVAGTIAEPGRRLRRRVPPAVILIFVGLGLFWAFMFFAR